MRTESQTIRLEYAKVPSMSVFECEAEKGHPQMDIKRQLTPTPRSIETNSY